MVTCTLRVQEAYAKIMRERGINPPIEQVNKGTYKEALIYSKERANSLNLPMELVWNNNVTAVYPLKLEQRGYR